MICSSMGAASSVGTSSIGALVGAGGTSMEVVNLAQLLKNPSGRATQPKTMSSEKEMYFSIILCNSRTDLAKRHG